MATSKAAYVAPEQIPAASPAQLQPVLLRLLECPKSLLPTLSQHCAAAIADLPDEDRPRSYEGLLDVARFCIEDEPGWEVDQRALFLGGHPRIGAPITANTAELSEESRLEQLKGGQVDPETLQRLAKLNALYEARYPGLRFVTYVAGRSRAAVADELAQNLGESISGLAAASELPASEVKPQGTPEWDAELERGSDALWEIAADRAGKLLAEVTATTSTSTHGEKIQQQPAAPTPAVAAQTVDTKAAGAGAVTGENSSVVGQDVPFLSLAAFRMLVLSSPVLESFFESDLTPSFYLEPVERSQSGGAYAWHTAPSLPGAPRAVPGAAGTASKDGATWTGGVEASYSRDVTTGARGKVVGFLSGLLGEEGQAKMTAFADQVGQRLQTHTVSGPKPSFGRSRTLDGGRMDTQELREKEAEERRRANEERNKSLGSRLANALRGPAAARPAPSAATAVAVATSSSAAVASGDSPSSNSPSSAAASERGRGLNRHPSSSSLSETQRRAKRMSLRGTDLAMSGPLAAAETLRAAQAALVEERPAFVIDEVGEGGAEDEEEDEEEVNVEDAAPGDEGQVEGLVSGREAEAAKLLRQAAPQ